MIVFGWGPDDARFIRDGVALLLIRAAGILAIESYIKPALIWLGHKTYKRADKLSGDRLPDFFTDTDNGTDQAG